MQVYVTKHAWGDFKEELPAAPPNVRSKLLDQKFKLFMIFWRWEFNSRPLNGLGDGTNNAAALLQKHPTRIISIVKFLTALCIKNGHIKSILDRDAKSILNIECSLMSQR